MPVIASLQSRRELQTTLSVGALRVDPSLLWWPGRWVVRGDGHSANTSRAAPMSGESGEPVSPPPLGKTQAKNFHFMGEFRNICDLGKPA